MHLEADLLYSDLNAVKHLIIVLLNGCIIYVKHNPRALSPSHTIGVSMVGIIEHHFGVDDSIDIH